MDDRLIVTASPHIRDNATTRGLMGNVLIALVPSIVASGLIFGMRAILLTAVTTLACVVFEYLYCKLMHKPNPVGDLSACVTGVILALNMPVSMPLWIAIVGALVAIVIIKQLFGGLGYNFANPALVGRIVLFLGFTSRMTAYVYPDMSVDALASATPLNAAVDLHSVSFVDMLLGIHGGMMGETCVIAILLGLAYLLFTHTIEFTIPASIVGTMYVLTLLSKVTLLVLLVILIIRLNNACLFQPTCDHSSEFLFFAELIISSITAFQHQFTCLFSSSGYPIMESDAFPRSDNPICTYILRSLL